MKCAECEYCHRPSDEWDDIEYCCAGMWCRETDDFLAKNEDVERYVNVERLCSEFKPAS